MESKNRSFSKALVSASRKYGPEPGRVISDSLMPFVEGLNAENEPNDSHSPVQRN